MIYLDNNATTRIDPLVVDRMHELMKMRLANASSQHAAGRQARQIVEQARESILKNCGGRTSGMASDQLLFTSGGTESNNLAIFGLSENRPGAIVVSSIEHPSVLAAAEYAAAQGREVRYLRCSTSGVVCLDQLEEWLATQSTNGPIALVSLMLANNETGVWQPVAKAAAMCRKAGVLIHTDAVQVLGKSEMDFAGLDVDAMTVTAHKLHGPVGIGALILRHGVVLSPQTFGGFQQLGQRPGTEMPVLAGGFEIAVAKTKSQLDERVATMLRLRDALQSKILSALPSAVAIGAESERLPHTLSISFPGVDRQALQLALDMAGIACSTGSACASGSSQPSHVLEAMHLDASIVSGGIRLSVSAETLETEIDQAVASLAAIVPRLLKW
ncbi:MAG: cysteine desulfurase family protein [Planctomycetota bacterium]|nr:cysteine desulfurase family protein [Planctomycetota bacterium]